MQNSRILITSAAGKTGTAADLGRCSVHNPPRKTWLRRIGRTALSFALLGLVAMTLAMVGRTVVPYGSVTEQARPTHRSCQAISGGVRRSWPR